MKQNKEKILNKIYASAIAIMMITIILGSVFAVRTITDTSDTIFTTITTSEGGSYTATAANLQTAINSLSNTSGWVDGGNNNISISSTIKLGTSCELRNVKLWLASSANVSMLNNYDKSNGNDNIYIHDVTLEGNGLNQPEWFTMGMLLYYVYAIWFQKGDNIRVENCIVNNSACGGIFIVQSTNSSVKNNIVKNTGDLYKYSGNGYTQWQADGIYLYNCSNSLVTGNIIHETYSAGIVIEGYTGAPEAWENHDIVVSDNIVSNTSYGYYFEAARDCICNDNIAVDCTDIQVFGSSAGFRTHSTCDKILFSGCKSYNSGNFSTNAGTNITYVGCDSVNSEDNGFYTSGRYTRYEHCNSINDGTYGFCIVALDGTAIGCMVSSCGSDGIYVAPSFSGYSNALNQFTLISDCIINDTGAYAIHVYAYNTSVDGNTIRECTYGIQTESPVKNSSIRNNDIRDCDSRPVRCLGLERSIISNNFINGGAWGGAGIDLSACKNVSVIGNIIEGSGGNYPEFGVRELTSGSHNWILFNKGIDIGTLTTVVSSTTKVNCSDASGSIWDNWNFDV